MDDKERDPFKGLYIGTTDALHIIDEIPQLYQLELDEAERRHCQELIEDPSKPGFTSKSAFMNLVKGMTAFSVIDKDHSKTLSNSEIQVSAPAMMMAHGEIWRW